MPNIFNFNPKTQGYINNALDTLTLWLGGTPRPRTNQQNDGSQDQGGNDGYPNQPTPTKGGNTLLYVLLGAGGAALVTYLIVKKKP